MELQTGAEIERYVVESELGRGGMAVVYRVRHARLGSHHALKLLSLTSRSLQERLLQEGQLQATLRHPNIVAVTDVLDVEGQPGLVMELVEGPTLEDWLLTRRPSYDQAERLFRGVLSAVEAAHAKDLVHRDLKPANVLLAPYSGELVPKVADFGLAKALAEASSRPGTRSGVSMGTPKYMAPEQIRDAGGVDARADLFSLGAILYELVTGRPPFDGPDVLSVFNAVASGSFAPLPDDVPEHLARAVRGCLVVDPRGRIPDCATLRAVLDGDRVPDAAARPASPAATMVPDSFGGDSSDTWSPELAAAEPAQPAAQPAAHTLVPEPGASLDRTGPDSLGGSLEPESTAPPRKKRRLAWFLTGGGLAVAGIVAGLLALVVGSVAGWWALSAWHQARVQELLSAYTHDEVRVAEVHLRPGHVLLRGVDVVGRDGQVVAHAPRVRVVGESLWFMLGLDTLDDVRVDGLTITLHRDDQGWILPERTLQVLSGQVDDVSSLPRIQGVDLIITQARLAARTEQGVLNTRIDTLDLNELGLDPAGWRADDVTVSGVYLDGPQPIGSVVEISAIGGEARVRGLELYVRSRRDGRLDLPPVVADGVPAYLGGGLQSGQTSWLQALGQALPVGIDAVRVETGSVHLVDTAHADRDVTWTLDLDQASGVRQGNTWRVTALGMVHGGRATLDGGLDADGAFQARLDVRDVPLPAFAPYVAGDLAERDVAIEGGMVQAAFELEERGEALGWHGVVDLEDVALIPRTQDVRLTVRERRLLAPRDQVEVVADGLGVLSDPTYQPVEDVRVAVVQALLEPAGRGRVLRRRYAPTPSPDEEPTDVEDTGDAAVDAPVAVSGGAAGTPGDEPGSTGDAPDTPSEDEAIRIPQSMREAWRRRKEEGRRKLQEILKRR